MDDMNTRMAGEEFKNNFGPATKVEEKPTEAPIVEPTTTNTNVPAENA
jgi:hypothetical protein